MTEKLYQIMVDTSTVAEKLLHNVCTYYRQDVLTCKFNTIFKFKAFVDVCFILSSILSSK